jgi:hypothetical protein
VLDQLGLVVRFTHIAIRIVFASDRAKMISYPSESVSPTMHPIIHEAYRLVNAKGEHFPLLNDCDRANISQEIYLITEAKHTLIAAMLTPGVWIELVHATKGGVSDPANVLDELDVTKTTWWPSDEDSADSNSKSWDLQLNKMANMAFQGLVVGCRKSFLTFTMGLRLMTLCVNRMLRIISSPSRSFYLPTSMESTRPLLMLRSGPDSAQLRQADFCQATSARAIFVILLVSLTRQQSREIIASLVIIHAGRLRVLRIIS